jgi:hyperosmotically inducible protein
MKSIRFTSVASAALALLCSVGALNVPLARAQSSTSQAAPDKAPDNSKQNKNHAQTADNQTNAKSDRLMTASARKAIMADKDLSTYAHNVKIVTVNGAVTLKGPVKSDEEKQKVAADVSSVVSADKITNELTVKQ